MKMQIGKWGNSLAVRLPKELVDRFQLSEGGEFDIDLLAQALEQARQTRREEALAAIREMKWTLPVGWKFDHDEAHDRGDL